MTAEPQIGYPGQHEGWQQTPAGFSDDGGPSGLSHAFAGYSQQVPPEPNPAPPASFSGHDPDAPSGLSFTPPPPAAYPDAAYAAPYSDAAHEVPPQSAYSDAAYAPSAQAAYSDAAYAPPAQAAYSNAAYAAQAQPAYSDGAYSAPQAAYSAPPQATYPPQEAYPPQAAYPAPQSAYPAPQAAYPAPPQAAFPGSVPGGYGPAGPGTPGYLQPYGPAAGPSGRGPGVGPVVGITFFFGPFGAISAARRAERARAVGDSTGKYWIAFGATLVGCWVLGAILAILSIAMNIAGDGTASKTSTTIALQQSIVQQGTFPDATGRVIKVTAATCVATALVPNSNWGTYTCTLGLVDGTKDKVVVSVDSGGKWRVIGQAK
jgi:hypothetical protein